MNAISVTRRASWLAVAIVITLLLFGVGAYFLSAFIWLLPHAFRHAREMPAAGEFGIAIEAMLFAARSVGATYPGSLMTPTFLGAGLCMAAAGLWRGRPPVASALVSWLVITLAIAGAGLYVTETTVAGLVRAWPFYFSDAIIACLCWALARLFW